jgi:hypothetical protein
MQFQSQAERKAHPILTSFGFQLENNNYLPLTFTDAEGTKFKAKADYYHPELGIYIEVKSRSLNSMPSKARAEAAYSAIPLHVREKCPTFFYTKYQWNHAAEKIGITQEAIGHENFMVVFTEDPTKEKKIDGVLTTLELIEKHGVVACDLKYFPVQFRALKFTKLLQKRGWVLKN